MEDEEVFWLQFDFSGDSFQAGKALAEGAHDATSARLAAAWEHLATGLG